jgi:glycine cleavage system H protein
VAEIPADLSYTADHEYVKATAEKDVVIIGITHYAQDQLGDVVFVDLPKPGAKFDAHAVFGTIEAVKAVSELFSPIAGEVVAVNAALDADPATINRDPYGEGWMIRLKVADAGELGGLLSAADYKKKIGQ